MTTPPTDPRGTELTCRLQSIEADLSAWMDEIPSDDIRAFGEAALLSMEHARNAIAAFARRVQR